MGFWEKYYPPDFDPSKIPRMKLPRNRQYTVRLMAPFNMRCVTCGEYIYKGKKFNARKEDVEGEDYLGIRIYRFYIKCTRCLQEISFKTDPRNTDYEIEAGATRNFMALKLAEEQAQREEDERKEDEATNPMKLLENRTKQSKQELELLESLEELRDLNRRQRLIDYDSMLSQYDEQEARRRAELAQEEEDEKYISKIGFNTSGCRNDWEEVDSSSVAGSVARQAAGQWLVLADLSAVENLVSLAAAEELLSFWSESLPTGQRLRPQERWRNLLQDQWLCTPMATTCPEEGGGGAEICSDLALCCGTSDISSRNSHNTGNIGARHQAHHQLQIYTHVITHFKEDLFHPPNPHKNQGRNTYRLHPLAEIELLPELFQQGLGKWSQEFNSYLVERFIHWYMLQ
ncbi:hypothetical protein PR048_028252 [Dryococelus australis]|uniref:Splicing factor YJU2 n=1 Tax=Dryococelus australis TaxID=614101 RepID=A0ABQ9GIQ9_9NEOP|nr:hypothetical protein PR048_028252 [Dryococelus australis]